jgi:UDP:flavonoid glycosyltransferase YjiC (YdhE family)
MKHIAIVTSGLVGITNASIKLVSKLKTEGHRVTYLYPKNIKETIEMYEIEYIQLPEINFSFSFLETNSTSNMSSGKLKKYLYHFTHLNRQYEEGIYMLNFSNYENILNELKPDLVLVDQELHEVIFSSIKLKVPIKLLSQHLFNEMQIGLPPIRTNIIPGIGFKGSKLGIFFAWLFVKSKIWSRLWINRVTLKNNRRTILKHYSKKIGFPYKYLISRNFPSVYINSFIPTLSMNLRELEFSFSKPENLIYIGAMVLVKRLKSDNYQDISKEIDTIINLKKKHNKKLIYCSFTTMTTTSDITFIKNVIEAFNTEPNWVLIMSLGGKLSTKHFKEIPKNVHLFKWVPQLKVLKESDCSINHGGIHTINECILCKVPMLVYSGKKYDQSGCAARIAYHGLGLIGDRNLDDSRIINSKISKILNNSGIQNTIKQMHDTKKNYESKNISSYL